MNKINLNTIATDGKARVNDVIINGKSLQTPTFMPVATETMGSWAPMALSFIKDIGKRISEQTGDKRATKEQPSCFKPLELPIKEATQPVLLALCHP